MKSTEQNLFRQRMKVLLLFVCAAAVILVVFSIPVRAYAREFGNIEEVPAAHEYSESEAAAIFQEIRVFAHVPISVRNAIEIAEKFKPGAKVVDISFDGRAKNLTYKIKAYFRDETWSGSIDASTGGILGDGVIVPVASLDAKDKFALDHFKAAGIYLSNAVDIAEKSTGGKAVSAGLDEASGKLLFLVVVVTDSSLTEISIATDQEENQSKRSAMRRKAEKP